MQTLSVKTDRRTQLVDVTAQVQKAVASSGVATGICYLYVPHTTAAITINECADPDVARDVEGALDRLVPATGPYRHREGNSVGEPGAWMRREPDPSVLVAPNLARRQRHVAPPTGSPSHIGHRAALGS